MSAPADKKLKELIHAGDKLVDELDTYSESETPEKTRSIDRATSKWYKSTKTLRKRLKA